MKQLFLIVLFTLLVTKIVVTELAYANEKMAHQTLSKKRLPQKKLSQNKMEELKVIQSSPIKHNLLDSVHPVSIITGDELRKKTEQNIGETLANEAGIHASSFGPGASRPTIRGFNRQRVKILENSIDVMDVASVSEDHAVAIESSNANRIEILRGPEALVYGSGAIGGVINIFNNRIPVEITQPLTGFVDIQYGSNANQTAVIFDTSGRNGQFAWHIDAAHREADNLEISGFAETNKQQQEQIHGLVENSAYDTDSTSIGLVWNSNNLQTGLTVSHLETLYGVPSHSHQEEAHEEAYEEAHEDNSHDNHELETVHEEEEPVAINLEQNRYTLFANLSRPDNLFESIKLQLGLADYQHTELEGKQIGTVFENEQYELRLEALHQTIAGWHGVLGVQLGGRDFLAIGEEAFVPANKTKQRALFWVGANKLSDSITLESGIRFELQDINIQNSSSSSAHNAFSISFGASKKINNSSSLSASISHAERNPSAEELFSNGPHIATNSFEIGSAMLHSEIANNLDIGYRNDFGRLALLANIFYNQFDDYIFLQATNSEKDDLPVFVHQQQDAQFYGYEVELSIELLESSSWLTEAELFSDYTRGKLNNNANLPRIPPMRFGASINTSNSNWDLGANWVYHFEQNSIGPFETETASYNLFGFDVSYNFESNGLDWSLYLKGRNLNNSDGRRHTSRLKNLVPIAGRNITIGIRSNW